MKELLDGLQTDDRVHVGRNGHKNGRIHPRHVANDPSRTRRQIQQDAMRSAAVVDDLLDQQFLRGLVADSLIDVVADQVDGRVGAAAGW